MAEPITALGASVIKDGTPIPDVQTTSVRVVGGVQKYASTSTGGVMKRAKGVRDVEISIKFLCNDTAYAETLFKPHTSITLLQVYQNAVKKYQGPAFVEDLSFEMNYETGQLVAATATIGGNGPWTGLTD